SGLISVATVLTLLVSAPRRAGRGGLIPCHEARSPGGATAEHGYPLRGGGAPGGGTAVASPQWVAIVSSPARREWALKLARAHERGLAGATAQPEVREVIDQSWRRSARARVDPTGGIAPLVMSGDEAAARWEDSPLRVAEPSLRALL